MLLLLLMTLNYTFTLYRIKYPFLRPTIHHCGWRARCPRCPIEYSKTLMTWMRWEQRERGKNRETGEPIMCMEFVPYTGTREEFMEEFIAKFEEWMPHVYHDRNFKFMSKMQLERMANPELMADPTMMITRSDFAAAIEIPRVFSETCSYPERFNACCTVAVYRPSIVLDYTQRRKLGQRKVGFSSFFLPFSPTPTSRC